jgi:twitching motility protein PilT
MQVDEFLKKMVECGGSDAHLKVGMPPGVRVSGVLRPQGGEPLRPHDTEEIARALLDEEQWKKFDERGDLDCSYSIAGVARFRVNVMRQRGSISGSVKYCVQIGLRVYPPTGRSDRRLRHR